MSEHKALVTGGGKGIGRAIALALAAKGYEVTIMGRSEKALTQAIADGAAHKWQVVDVTDATALHKAVAGSGPYHILVNNAGAAESAPIAKTDLDLLRRMMAVNVESAFTATRAAVPGMLTLGSGRIINIASIAGLKGYAYVSAYSAAKHAVIGLVRSLALETAKSGITVNAVCPGFTETDLLEGSIDNIIRKTGRSREQAIAELSKHNPQGRLVAPSEVADAVLWLCGEGAGAVTGQAIAVAGGEV